jgi:hypothetical protein
MYLICSSISIAYGKQYVYKKLLEIFTNDSLIVLTIRRGELLDITYVPYDNNSWLVKTDARKDGGIDLITTTSLTMSEKNISDLPNKKTSPKRLVLFVLRFVLQFRKSPSK